jgi:hypothetical protein
MCGAFMAPFLMLKPSFYIGKRIIIPLRSLHKWAEDQANKQSTIFEK